MKNFKLVTKASQWKAVTSALSPLVEEAAIEITQDGLRSFTMDPSHTEAISFVWPKEKFSEFVVEEDTGINVPIISFAAVVKRFSNDDVLTITPQDNKIIISNGTKQFELTLLQYDPAENKKPKVNYTSKFDFPLSKLEEIMDDCRVFGIDVCWFESNESNLNYIGNDSSGKVSGVLLDHFDGELPPIGFNFTFMSPVLKSVKAFIAPEISMEILTQAPVRLTFTVPDVMVIQYWLAPAVPNDTSK